MIARMGLFLGSYIGRFKRERYDLGNEVRRFLTNVSFDNSASILEDFCIFIKELLGPSGFCVLKAGEDRRFEILLAEGEGAEEKGTRVLLDIGDVGQYFRSNHRVAYGYELIERGVVSWEALESALFVPIFSGKRFCCLVLLFGKLNQMPYSIKERMLLDGIAMTISHILEAKDQRNAMTKLYEEFQKQREYVVQEMHDGLGGMLTNISVASQVARLVFEDNPQKVKELLDLMSRSAKEASDFMRTGLTVLDNSTGELGVIIPNLRHRLGGMLEGYGLSVNFRVENGVETLKADARASLNIVRSIQEVLNNILKHAEAKCVVIRFTRDNGNLNICIEDDGKGFDPEKQTAKGFGLKHLSKRMEEVGGSARIHSHAGKGVKVTLTVPLSV